ncbi:MAG: DUF1559 family PulG-like putative transporter [Pirellulaceae bacterium]
MTDTCSHKEEKPMRYVLTWLLAVVYIASQTGCGGGLTQADMQKRAIRRSGSDNEDDKKPAAATAKQNRQEALEEALADSPPVQRPVKTAPPPSPPQDASVSPVANGAPSADMPVGAAKSDVQDTATATTAPAQSTVPDAVPGTLTKPAQPLSVIERRQRTIDNLTKIGEAIRRYTDEKRQVFLPATYDVHQKPLLSWRVELLPYLGYQQLYTEFRRDQPWNSPHNRTLMARIPEPYQSPERFDEKTNYLVPMASFTPFGKRMTGLSTRLIEDGLADTVAIVEVDDAIAVPWTQPADLTIELNAFRKQVETLREDGFFVVWLDGSVGRVQRDCSDRDLRAIFTFDSGDGFAGYNVRGEATATPTANLPTDPGAPVALPVPAVPAAQAETMAAASPAHPVPTAASASATNATQPVRLPVPDPLSLERARELVRQLYKKEFDAQQEISQQQALAQRMLKQVDQMSNDPAGHYVLLEIVIKIATRIGDTSTAVAALDDLTENFEVDELSKMHETLTTLAKKDRSRVGVSLLLAKSRVLVDTAIQQEQFETAESLCQIATAAARQLGDRDAVNQIQQQAQLVEESQKSLRDVQRILANLTDQDDPNAHLRVGRYYCFTKGEWEKGLPLLAKGSDSRLKQLAEEELRNPTVPEDQLRLADGWWELGVQDSARQKPLQQRAAFWYERALPALSSGLWRAKVEMRLKEFHQLHGAATVASSASRSTSPRSAADN